jgi:DNA-directed RNA polymerase subunit M/transcription elongation factor TFIIS
MIYRLTCPCGAMFDVDDRAIGRYLTCAKCRRRMRIERTFLKPVRVHRFTCDCGAMFRVEEKAVGGTFQCPVCRAVMRIVPERLSAVSGEQARVSKSARSTVPVEFGSAARGRSGSSAASRE